MKVTVRLNFFIISKPLRFAEIEKAVDNALTIPCGQWRRRMESGLGVTGEGCAARRDSPDALDCHSRDVLRFRSGEYLRN